jgi:general secretion pathway protein K
VLLFFAFLSAVAVRLASNHAMLIAGSRNSFTSDLALNYALGGEEMARQVLYEDFTHSGKDVDHLQEAWARGLPPLSLDEGGSVEIQISDLQGCFNLNALGSGTAQAVHVALINLLNITGLPPAIADRALDWVDADDITTGFGGEDNEYLLAKPAFRTPNGRFGDTSEIRVLLEGIDTGEDDGVNRRLLPLLCALPIDQLQVNVNTARGEVLAALLPGSDLSRPQALSNQPRGFRTVGEFVQSHPEYQTVTAMLRTTSEWFRINVRVQIDRTMVIMSSLAFRDPATGRVVIRSRDFGQDFRSRVRLTTEDETAPAAEP